MAAGEGRCEKQHDGETITIDRGSPPRDVVSAAPRPARLRASLVKAARTAASATARSGWGTPPGPSRWSSEVRAHGSLREGFPFPVLPWACSLGARPTVRERCPDAPFRFRQASWGV